MGKHSSILPKKTRQLDNQEKESVGAMVVHVLKGNDISKKLILSKYQLFTSRVHLGIR